MSIRILLFVMLASAHAYADGVVLESYTGDRPADAPRLIAPILEELSRRKFQAGDTVARTYETQVSRSARQQTGLPADFAAQVDRGFKAWVAGRFDESIKILVPLVETAHANTGDFAKDPALREPLLKGLIALALAQQRIGDPSAMRATFGEILRSFPDTQISRATYGPDAQQAFEQVRREVVAGGKGKLTIKVADDTAVVFIDEAYRAVGSTSAELLPGEYRVVVMMNKQPSRNHRVTVRANAETKLDIDAKFDQSVRTTGYTGLSFATQAERDAHEAAFAQRFANSIGASAVAVVGIDQVRGRNAVVGSLVSLQTGREIRRASIPVEPDPSTDRLKALARFLGGEDAAPGLDVQFSGAAGREAAIDKPDETPGASRGRWGGWRWITAGVAVAGLGTGGYLLAIDGNCPTTPPVGQACDDFYVTANYGYLALGGAAVFAGVSIYLFATHSSANTPYVAPTPGGAVAGFTTRW